MSDIMVEHDSGPNAGGDLLAPRPGAAGRRPVPWWRPGIIAILAVAFLFVLDLFFGGLVALGSDACGSGGSCPADVAYQTCMRYLVIITPAALLISFLLPHRPSWHWPRLVLLYVAIAAALAPIVGALS